MLKRTALIELSRDRLAVIVPSTTAPSSSCVFLDPERVARAWTDGLASLDEPLHRLITEAGVRGGTARLAYTSPDAHASILSLPAATRHADRAARLAMAESCGFPVPEMFAPAVPLVVDRPSDARRAHWLLAADRAEFLEAAAAWLQRAGVRPDALIPLESIALARAITEAIHLDATKPAGPAIALRIGRSSAAIAGAHNGRLLFARPLPVSVATIVDALSAPIYPAAHRADPDTSIQPLTLPRDIAMRIAFEAGFASESTRLNAAPNLTARDLRPTLQPILQRLVVETRQTLRFGIPSSDTAPGQPRVQVSGAGVAINGLVAAIAANLELHTTAHPGHERFRNDEPTSPGSLLEAIRLRDLPKINLLTGEPARRIARRRLGVTAAAGIAIAAIAGAADYASTINAATQLERSRHTFAAVLGHAQELAARREQLTAAINAVQNTNASIDRALSPALPAADLLRDIALRLPPSVKLLELELAESQGLPTARLRAIAIGPRDPDSTTNEPGVADIVATLEASPLILRATVGAIGSPPASTADAATRSITIELKLELVPIPPSAAIATVPEDAP